MNNNPESIISVNANNISNELLKRLVKEVQYDKKNNVTAYDRTHNRHNRGGGCK